MRSLFNIPHNYKISHLVHTCLRAGLIEFSVTDLGGKMPGFGGLEKVRVNMIELSDCKFEIASVVTGIFNRAKNL